MQNILDRTQESLAEAFASLATTARRQQRLYFATIAALMVIVAFSASLLIVLAINKQLDLQRTVSAQNASDISLFLHRNLSFLKRTELTVQFYQTTQDVHRVPKDIEQQIRQSGVAVGRSSTLDTAFNLIVSDATRDAWGADASTKLWRLAEAADATLGTRQALELPYRAMLIGISEDYAVILPAIDPQTDTKALPLKPELAARLRETIMGVLAAQTGKRTLAKGQHVLIGPYPDPLLGSPVVTALSLYAVDDTQTTLIAMTVPVAAFLAVLHEPANSATLLLVSERLRPITPSPPLPRSTEEKLRAAAARTPPGGIRYTLGGAVFVDAVTPGYSLLVSYLSWGALIAALAWQLGVIVGLGLLLMVAMGLTAKFWGMRLLRRWHEEAARALEGETINHIVVSATPVGLCIVRQRDFSIMTSNVLARELLHLDHATSLPAHIAAAYTERSLHAQSSTAQSAKTAEFIVPALPGQTDALDPQMLQISYATARYTGEDVFFCAILDITVRHALGRQLREAQRETETMMRTQTNFFAAMSHEIRTPMNALLGNLELLSRSPG
ncbi:MAG TPA: histidine kinase dimerization/phospho-acceptor domain-containing protein, partial [Paraburkholderia sp.]